MDLSQFEPQRDRSFALDITVALLAELIGEDADTIAGLFGAGTLGQITVSHDDSYTWADVEGDPSGTRAALIPVRGDRDFVIAPVIDHTDKGVVAISEAIETMRRNHHRVWDSEDYGYQVVSRYARLLGFDTELETLTGEMQGCDLDVLLVHPAGAAECESLRRNANPFVGEFREYWAGKTFIYDITLSSPVGGPQLDAGMGGTIGEAYTIQMIGEDLTAMVSGVRKEIRTARAQAAADIENTTSNAAGAGLAAASLSAPTPSMAGGRSSETTEFAAAAPAAAIVVDGP